MHNGLGRCRQNEIRAILSEGNLATHLNSRLMCRAHDLRSSQGLNLSPATKPNTSTMVLATIAKQDPHSLPSPSPKKRQTKQKQKHGAGGTAQQSVHHTSMSLIFWTQVKSRHGGVCVHMPSQHRGYPGLMGKLQTPVRPPVSKKQGETIDLFPQQPGQHLLELHSSYTHIKRTFNNRTYD